MFTFRSVSMTNSSPWPYFSAGVDQQAEDVGRLQRRIDEIHHPPVERVERLVDARVVDEDDLAPVRSF